MNPNAYLSKNFAIWRDAEQLVIQTEQAVRQFSRYHKYTLGTELRQMAMQVLSNTTHAINQKPLRHKWVARLVLMAEELKLKIQLGKSLQAFSSFKVFESLARLAVAVARQARAWQTKLQSGAAQSGS